ncbi:MAG: transporter substrate-binding domain-containing protein [Propionibacteriaceae bacterium]
MRNHSGATRRFLVSLVLGVTVLLSGCGITYPADPDDSLQRIRSTGELRVGVSPHPPFTVAPSSPAGVPTGSEVDLVLSFAASQRAEPVWTVDGEEHLVELMKVGRLDIVIGGLTDKSPWSTDVALTRPYVETTEGGKSVAHVMATTMGENALLTALERHLDGSAT